MSRRSRPTHYIEISSSPESTPNSVDPDPLSRPIIEPIGFTLGEQRLLSSRLGNKDKSGTEEVGKEGEGRGDLVKSSRESQWRALILAGRGKAQKRPISPVSAVDTRNITPPDSHSSTSGERPEPLTDIGLISPSASPLDQISDILSMRALEATSPPTTVSSHEAKRPRALNRDKLTLAYAKSSVIPITTTTSKVESMIPIDQRDTPSSSSSIKRKAVPEDSVNIAPSAIQPKKRKPNPNQSPFAVSVRWSAVQKRGQTTPAMMVDTNPYREDFLTAFDSGRNNHDKTTFFPISPLQRTALTPLRLDIPPLEEMEASIRQFASKTYYTPELGKLHDDLAAEVQHGLIWRHRYHSSIEKSNEIIERGAIYAGHLASGAADIEPLRARNKGLEDHVKTRDKDLVKTMTEIKGLEKRVEAGKEREEKMKKAGDNVWAEHVKEKAARAALAEELESSKEEVGDARKERVNIQNRLDRERTKYKSEIEELKRKNVAQAKRIVEEEKKVACLRKNLT